MTPQVARAGATPPRRGPGATRPRDCFVSVLVPQHGDDLGPLSATIRSLRRQDADGWQVVVASAQMVGGLVPDHQVQVTSADSDDDGALLAAAAQLADGRYLAVVHPGDQLEPGVLDAVALVASGAPAVLYTDEQWPGSAGAGSKPDYLPLLVESLPYLGRLMLVRADVAARVGGFQAGTGPAAEHDLALRVTELTDDVRHVPVIGLTRTRPPDDGPQARRAVVRAVEGRLARTGRRGEVEQVAEVPLGTRTWLAVEHPPLVSIVVPTAGTRREVDGRVRLLVEECVRSILAATTYPRWEVVLVPSEHTPPGVVDTLADLLGDRLVVAPVSGRFSFSVSINEGARHATGDLLLLLNDDTEVIEPRWLERMVAVAADPRVGVVGAKLLYPDGTVQHVGVTFDDVWGPIHPLACEDDDAGPFGAKVLDTDWSAVTGACLLTPAALFAQVGGLSTDLPVNFDDIDYCMKVQQAGRWVVTTPFARLRHHEQATRGHHLEQWEMDTLQETWHPRIRRDPHVEYRSVR